MEDFSTWDASYVAGRQSEHSDYPFRLSARDVIRFDQREPVATIS